MDDIKFMNSGKESKKIEISDKALKKINEVLKEQNKKDFGIRVVIGGGGCCGGGGFQMGLEKEKDADDKVIETKKLKVYLDPMTYMNLNDMKIDYISNDVEEGFKITNGPEHEHQKPPSDGCGTGCGCG